jgi:hypothetical protein
MILNVDLDLQEITYSLLNEARVSGFRCMTNKIFGIEEMILESDEYFEVITRSR